MKNRTFLVSMDVMSLDTNIQQNEGILKLSVTKHMKISTKTTHSYTLLAGNSQINPQRKFLPLQWKALPTKPWNCNGHKDSSFDSFANIFMTYIETTTLSKTVFRTTVWKCYIHDIFSLWDMSNQTSKPSLNKQTYITQLLNSWPKHLTLRCSVFRRGCIQRHKIQEKIYP